MFKKVVGAVSMWLLFKWVVPLIGIGIDYYRLKRKEKKDNEVQ